MIGIQLNQRLRDLHSLGIIHNDIKPDNMILDQSLENIYLIDFGLSC